MVRVTSRRAFTLIEVVVVLVANPGIMHMHDEKPSSTMARRRRGSTLLELLFAMTATMAIVAGMGSAVYGHRDP